MKIFRLAPESSGGESESPSTSTPGLLFSILYSGVSFGVVSIVAYSFWAYELISGTVAMYCAIAIVYIGLAGLALSRLVAVTGAWKRFPFLFALGFILYALGWCALWFGLKGKFHGDIFGSAVGLAAMTWLLIAAFGRTKRFLPIFGVVFMFHTLGFALGDVLHVLVRGASGRMLWGAAHGVGFGAGLGYLLFESQRRFDPVLADAKLDSAADDRGLRRL